MQKYPCALRLLSPNIVFFKIYLFTWLYQVLVAVILNLIGIVVAQFPEDRTQALLIYRVLANTTVSPALQMHD